MERGGVRTAAVKSSWLSGASLTVTSTRQTPPLPSSPRPRRRHGQTRWHCSCWWTTPGRRAAAGAGVHAAECRPVLLLRLPAETAPRRTGLVVRDGGQPQGGGRLTRALCMSEGRQNRQIDAVACFIPATSVAEVSGPASCTRRAVDPRMAIPDPGDPFSSGPILIHQRAHHRLPVTWIPPST